MESTKAETIEISGSDQTAQYDLDKSESLPSGQTKRSQEYTSENFKLEITNLPNKVEYYQVKLLLEQKAKVNFRKIRMGRGKAFVAFRSAEERDAAIVKINDCEFKGRPLKAETASPRFDPFAKRQKTDEAESSEKNLEEKGEAFKEPPTEADINSQVCPMWDKDYDHQIRYKSTSLRAILKLSKQLIKLCPTLRRDHPKLFEWTQKNAQICCQFDGVEPSPVLNGYRNKCEFNVGPDGTIGFRVGRYKDGSESVYKVPANCPIVSKKMFEIIGKLQCYLKDQTKTKLKGFSNATHEGHVRQVTLRTNRDGEVLVIIDMHPQDLSPTDEEFEIKAIVTELTKDDKIIGIFFNLSERGHLSNAQKTLKLAYGQDHIVEYLEVEPEKPLRFHIGPTSFFQINTKAAELLYRSVINVAKLGPKSLVLDVGCGTGTIGISLAQQVSYVIGIEIVAQAVEDAKMNAKENNITNITFLNGKAEDLIQESIKILNAKLTEHDGQGEIVAIVDPPRQGFNNSFIKTIRASNIKKIIYIACDPKSNTNLVTLCRPPSKAYQGKPFVPVRAKGFDLFPHTKFCELLMVYERLDEDS